MRKTFFFLGLIVCVFKVQSQKRTLYIDENYLKINSLEFKKKLKSNLFFIARVENDTVILKKLRFKEFFGNIGIEQKSRVNKLFHKKFKVDTTKVWLIHYQDTLPNIKLMPKKSGIIFLDSLKRKHKHVRSFEDDKKIIPKELYTYRKVKNLEFLHFYDFNKGYPAITKEYSWFKDYNLTLKKTFTDGMKMYKIIIIHKNGDFYVYSFRKQYSEIKKLLNFKSFTKLKKKFERKYMSVEKG